MNVTDLFGEEVNPEDFFFRVKDSEERLSKNEIKPSVYLAGTISSDIDKETPDSIKWRKEFKNLLDLNSEFDWVVYDPTDGKNDGFNYVKTDNNSHKFNPYYIVKSDLKSVRSCNIFVVNFTSEVRSIGTLIEYGVAIQKGIPVVAIINKGSEFESHPFILETVDTLVYSLEEAVSMCDFIYETEL